MVTSAEQELSLSIAQDRINNLEGFLNSSMALLVETRLKISSFNDSLRNGTVQLRDDLCTLAGCSAGQQLIGLLNASLSSLENRTELLENGQFTASSCAALPFFFPSGYYWVRASNGSAVRVYCDMNLLCGNVTGGWTRVVELNMKYSSHQCPSGLMERNDSNIRTCVSLSDAAGCSSTIFSTVNIGYTRVCGKFTGYQIGNTNAFASPLNNISSYYVDGVSITHGSPRQHIWTFAAARDVTSNDLDSKCPCIVTNGTSEPPSFVGDDYFCDTGSDRHFIRDDQFFSENPLWDGEGCVPPNTCCSFNTPPWFYKQLPQPTTDDIEMRVCRDEVPRYEDVAIEMIEVYIQ